MVYDGVLKGRGVSLRSVSEADCNASYLRWMTDSETNRYMETRWCEQTPETIRAFVRDVRSSSHSWLFAIMVDGRHVGNIKIGPVHPRYKNADISYFIGEKECRGRGAATEAIGMVVKFGFEDLGLHRIQAGAFRENQASQRVLERNGFSLESIVREKYFLTSEDDWTDCLEYALLYKEWREKHESR